MRAKSASGSEYRAVNTLGSMEKGMALGSKQESWNIPGPVNSKMHLDLAIVKGPTDVVIFFYNKSTYNVLITSCDERKRKTEYLQYRVKGRLSSASSEPCPNKG